MRRQAQEPWLAVAPADYEDALNGYAGSEAIDFKTYRGPEKGERNEYKLANRYAQH